MIKEKRNRKMIYVVGILLLVIGVSFAYFIGAGIGINGSGGKTKGVTAVIGAATLNVEGTLNFNDLDILPGHKTISGIKLTATGNNEAVTYNLIWKGINTLNTPLKFSVYKTVNSVDTGANCQEETKVENGKQYLSEACTISNESGLGSVIASGDITKSETEETVVLAPNEMITATTSGQVVYYYVILEYPNLNESQNIDFDGVFRGVVTVNAGTTAGDVNILAVYIKEPDGTDYVRADDIPHSNLYTFNSEMSNCTNEAIPLWDGDKDGLFISNLNKSGTSCNLYFDKEKDDEAPVISKIEAIERTGDSIKLRVNATDNKGIESYQFKKSTDSEYSPAQASNTYLFEGLGAGTFTFNIKVCDASGNCVEQSHTDSTGLTTDSIIAGGTATDDSMFSGTSGNGVYTWTKGDYSGGSQTIKYYRGNVSNNWVVFGKDGTNYIWWRIIRNNSNGSIRMIYAGTSASKTSAPATTGTGTQLGTKAFNTSYNNNMYVGFKYTNNQVHGNGTNSTILGAENSTDKTTLYGWYNQTLAKSADYSGKIDLDAGFCNDRGPSTSSSSLNGSGGTGTTQTYYAAYIRLITNKAPSLLCASTSDIFKTPVGLITADEVSMGGMVVDSSKTNTSSYLYTNSHYWTMSPYSAVYAVVFFVHSSGCLSSWGVFDTSPGVRPVVNLKSDTLFVAGGAGTNTNPYVVIGT